jgi:hypothetical protein
MFNSTERAKIMFIFIYKYCQSNEYTSFITTYPYTLNRLHWWTLSFILLAWIQTFRLFSVTCIGCSWIIINILVNNNPPPFTPCFGSGFDPYSIGSADPDPDNPKSSPNKEKWRNSCLKGLNVLCRRLKRVLIKQIFQLKSLLLFCHKKSRFGSGFRNAWIGIRNAAWSTV